MSVLSLFIVPKMIQWAVLIALISLSSIGTSQSSGQNRWNVTDPILLHGAQGTFSEIAVKDPSIVYYESMWHLFFTARSKEEYTTGYVSAKNLSGLQSADRHELKMVRGNKRYGCAPQVFYLEPQGIWCLIYQTQDSNYQPAFSTTPTLSNPDSWSKALPLVQKDRQSKWIDFWVICDDIRCYLFYTQGHDQVMVRSTSITDFPSGWSEDREVLKGVHEAVHVYKVKDHDAYHMIYELNNDGIRSFGLAVATHLEGPWVKVRDDYAKGADLIYTAGSDKWTEMVSHGEVIRSGHNQKMEYKPEGCKWIIQGILEEEVKEPYKLLPWKLGIIEKMK